MPTKRRKRQKVDYPFENRNRPTSSHSRPGVFRAQHIRPGEFRALFKKLEFQLRKGLFFQAEGCLQAFIQDKRTFKSEFSGYQSSRELPLGMSGIDTDLLNAIEEGLGITKVGEFEDCDESKLIELPHIGAIRLVKAKAAVSKLRREFAAWKGRYKPKPKEAT